jgi:hypothetical protein
MGLGLMGAIAWVPGCTRTNPGFGDGQDAGTDTANTNSTDSASTSAASDSGGSAATGSTTEMSTVTDGSTSGGDTDGVITDSTGGSTGGVLACEGDVGFLSPKVYSDELEAYVTAEMATTTWAGDVEGFQDGTLVIRPCGAGCNCGDTPAVRFELGQQPGPTTTNVFPQCAHVMMTDTNNDGKFDGFMVASQAEAEIFFAGYDGSQAPVSFTDVLDSVSIEWMDDSVRECGTYHDGCPTDRVPGQYAVRYQSSAEIYPGEYTEPRSLGGRNFVFHNRMALYSVEGRCGEAASWTMEFAGGG